VKRKEIRKENGGGMRKLGIPTVVDRFIQQMLLQAMTPIWEPRKGMRRRAEIGWSI